MRSAAWSFSEHRTLSTSSRGFQVCLPFSRDQRRPLGGPSFFHFSPTEAFPPSFLTLFHSSRPHTSTSAKRFNSRMWSHTTSCFCSSAKNCQGFFCPLFPPRPSNVPPSEAPEEMWHMDVITQFDRSFCLWPVRVKMLRRRPRRSFKSTVILQTTVL